MKKIRDGNFFDSEGAKVLMRLKIVPDQIIERLRGDKTYVFILETGVWMQLYLDILL